MELSESIQRTDLSLSNGVLTCKFTLPALLRLNNSDPDRQIDLDGNNIHLIAARGYFHGNSNIFSNSHKQLLLQKQ